MAVRVMPTRRKKVPETQYDGPRYIYSATVSPAAAKQLFRAETWGRSVEDAVRKNTGDDRRRYRR